MTKFYVMGVIDSVLTENTSILNQSERQDTNFSGQVPPNTLWPLFLGLSILTLDALFWENI